MQVLTVAMANLSTPREFWCGFALLLKSPYVARLQYKCDDVTVGRVRFEQIAELQSRTGQIMLLSFQSLFPDLFVTNFKLVVKSLEHFCQLSCFPVGVAEFLESF